LAATVPAGAAPVAAESGVLAGVLAAAVVEAGAPVALAAAARRPRTE